MNREPVDSSHLTSIGYDEATSTLEVEFKNGNIYHYLKVPKTVHKKLMSADPIGVHFNQHIMGGGFQFQQRQT